MRTAFLSKSPKQFQFSGLHSILSDGGGTPGQVILHPTSQDANNYDAILFEPSPNNNYANYPYNEVNTPNGSLYNCKSLIKFDLSSIPGGATITGVTLRLYYNFKNSFTSGTIKFHRVLSGNSDWNVGQCTWNNRKTSTNWAGSAGCSTSGTDYSSTEMGSSNADQTNPSYVDVTLDNSEFSLMVSNNYGMILFSPDMQGASAAIAYASFDDATAAYHPKLTIDYLS